MVILEIGRISCARSSGCLAVKLESLNISFLNKGTRVSYPLIQIQGAALSILNSTISGCFSSADGGCVQAYDQANVNITASAFYRSNTAGYGGAISAVGSQVVLQECLFVECHSALGGGAIWASTFFLFGSDEKVNTGVFIDKSDFKHCTTSGTGGSILALDTSEMYEAIEIWIRLTSFKLGSSIVSGGSVSFMGGSVRAYILCCSFEKSLSTGNGGAIYVAESAQLILLDSVLASNIAHGKGGGAMCSLNANVYLHNISTSDNQAPFGGGGVLLLEGISTVLTSGNENEIRGVDLICTKKFGNFDGKYLFDKCLAWILNNFVAVGVNSSLCTNGFTNFAVYGSCLASTYHHLDVQGLPLQEYPAYPGILFTVTVIKMDIYNQTILSDSSSLLQMLTSIEMVLQNDPSVSIAGGIISALQNGKADFLVTINPTFKTVDFSRGLTVLERRPYVYFKGIDTDSTSILMQSHPAEIYIESGALVCPVGYILILDKSRKGSCSECGAGTYSVNPLAGIQTQPSCFSCPLNGVCNDGTLVQPPLGVWMIDSGFFKLTSCPTGYQLINSNAFGVFSRDVQTCHPCSNNQYILNSNLSNFTCQPCPKGERTSE